MAEISLDPFCQPRATFSSRKVESAWEEARAYFDCGIAWVQTGAYEQGLEAWRQALLLAPDMGEAHAAAGSVYMVLGCWQEAVRSYRKAILAAPSLLESYYGLGSAYGRLGQYDAANEVYEQAFQQIAMEPHRNREAIVMI